MLQPNQIQGLMAMAIPSCPEVLARTTIAQMHGCSQANSDQRPAHNTLPSTLQ